MSREYLPFIVFQPGCPTVYTQLRLLLDRTS